MLGETEIFGRQEELDRLRLLLRSRKTFLVHGPQGVGKSILVRAAGEKIPSLLFCAGCASPQSLFTQILLQLANKRHRIVFDLLGRSPSETIKLKSSVALRGIARRVLETVRCTIVLDQLIFVPQTLAVMIKHLVSESATPVVAVSRSTHMEHLGYIAGMFPERRDRMEILNFDKAKAISFAEWLIAKSSLQAVNLPEFVRKVVDFSDGNPGAIKSMIEMAARPNYRLEDHIKITPLYIDFRLRQNECLQK